MRLLALSLALLLGSQTAVAQNDAAIVGRVLAADTKEPVAGAQVSVTPEGRPQTGPFAPLTAETDASGIYRFANLAPGRYRIMVRRTGYAIPGVPTSPPPFVQVAAGQAQNAPDVLLERGGVIAGRAAGSSGPTAGRRQGHGDETDEPLAAARAPYADADGQRRADQRPGRVPPAQPARRRVLSCSWSPAWSRASWPPAPRRAPRPRPPPTIRAPRMRRARTRIPLGPGQTVEGIVFNETMVPVFQITGVVVDETGAPVPEAMVMLMPDPAAGAARLRPRTQSARGSRRPVPARERRERRIRRQRVRARRHAGRRRWCRRHILVVRSASGGASGGVSSSVMVENRNGVTTSYRSDNASQVKVAVQDGHVTDLRLVVRR